MKIVVFLYQYYLKKYGHALAYFYVMLWFFIMFGVFLLMILQSIFRIDIPFIGYLHDKGTFYGYLEAFLVSLPFFALFYLVFPPQKIKKNQHRYKYSKYYIWYLRIGYIMSLILTMIIVVLSKSNS